jgi:LysM repeat protein
MLLASLWGGTYNALRISHKMDTLSRDSSTSNSSIMPLAGVILGAISLVVGIFAMVNANKVKATVAAQADQIARIGTIENEVRAAAAKSETDMRNLRDGVQNALNQVGTEIGSIRGQLTKMDEDMKKRTAAPAAGGGKAGATAPTGVRNADGTYTIAAGDTLAKVATKFGVRLDAILAENPGIDPRSLRVGQKIRLPAGR